MSMFTHRVRLHLRSINMPQVSEYDMLEVAEAVYGQYGIKIELVRAQTLAPTFFEQILLNVVDGDCKWEETSDEQKLLFSLGGKEGVLENDILVYFVDRIRKTNGKMLKGCAGHSPGQPAVMISSTGTKYTMAHEVCHVLLGKGFRPVHVDDATNNLMRSLTGGLTDIPILTSEQLKAIRASRYCSRI